LFTQFSIAQQATIKIQGFIGSAGSAERDTENDMAELSEGVQLVYQDQSISCDSARISLRSKKIEAKGKVRIQTPTTTIGGEHIILDYENSTGIIYGGFVQSGNVVFEGEVIQKISETEYYVIEANYSACTNCPSSWQFSGSSIRAELGGYAYIKNTLIKSGPVPIFWVPYLIVPLKSDRQSGLLTPDFEKTDTGGVAFAQSAFWALSRSTDATLTLKNYELRGLKGLAEYRYVLDENSSGQFNYATINDKAFFNEPRFQLFHPSNKELFNRWFIKYQHYQELPEGFVSRFEVNNASDLQYPRDFFRETQNHGDPAMENRFSITKNTTDQHYSLDSSYYINMLHADPLAGNNDSVHRLPEFRYSQTSKYIGNSQYLYTFDVNYVNFTRSSKAYDDLCPTTGLDGKSYRVPKTVDSTGTPQCDLNWEDKNYSLLHDGFFDPYTDLIRTGQRFDFNPTIYRTFYFANAFEITPRIGYRETHYLFPNLPVQSSNPVETTIARRFLRAEISTKTTFSRIYGDQSEVRSTLWKHEIQPEIRYTRLPWVSHKAHPFFGFTPDQAEAPYFTRSFISNEDTGLDSGLQFDYNDRLYDHNLLTYSVTNRWVQKRWKGNAPEYRQVGLLRLSQSYDAYQDERTDDSNKEPWSDISALLEVRFDNFEMRSETNYYPYQKISNTKTRARVIDDKGRFIEAGMILTYTIVPGQDTDVLSRVQDYNIAAGYLSPYIDFIGKMTIEGGSQGTRWEDQFRSFSRLTDLVKSYSYIAQVKPPGDCLALRFSFQQVTGGDNQINLNLLFSFDGKPPQGLSVENLNDLRI
jgi:LPS-assembly protein